MSNHLQHLREMVATWRYSAEDYKKAAPKAETAYEQGYLYGKVATREHDAEELEAAVKIMETELQILRCQERSAECGQCELRLGHEGKHLAGYLMWGQP